MRPIQQSGVHLVPKNNVWRAYSHDGQFPKPCPYLTTELAQAPAAQRGTSGNYGVSIPRLLVFVLTEKFGR